MPNRGIKEKLGQPVFPGRPRGKFKNPYGVPAQQFYKILRQQNREGYQKQILQQGVATQQPQAIAIMDSPKEKERRAISFSDLGMEWNT